MTWYSCIVNQVGPAGDAETPEPVIYINLTDTVMGAFTNTWFYAANGIQDQVLNVGIAAILSGRHVEVGATAPNVGNQPFTEVTRIYGFIPPPRPPAAPTDFHEISLSVTGTESNGALEVGWTDNSDNEASFVVTVTGVPSNISNEFSFPANTEVASISLYKNYEYKLHVVARNAVGDSAPSNTIDVVVGTVSPTPTPTATLSAAVGNLPTNIVNFGLQIRGSNFGVNETVHLTIIQTVNGEGGSTPLSVMTNAFGSFTTWYPGGTPDGLCPILVGEGEPQPPQMFKVTARGATSLKTASATAGPFTCPFSDPNPTLP
jgi:hypothetical protein